MSGRLLSAIVALHLLLAIAVQLAGCETYPDGVNVSYGESDPFKFGPVSVSVKPMKMGGRVRFKIAF